MGESVDDAEPEIRILYIDDDEMLALLMQTAPEAARF